jgi:phage protein D
MPRIPTFTLLYEGTDISESIKPDLLSIRYTDKLEGESDDVDVSLENRDRRWLGAWLPAEGALLTLTLGYENEESIPPISFEIDEPTFSGGSQGDTVSLKGVGAPITSTLREQKTRAFEETTLRAIAQTIADDHGLELVGEIPEIQLERVTQKEQTDLEFLRDLAAEYGLIFKIESATRLVFFRESDLEEADPIFELTIGTSAISRYGLRRGAKGTYKSAKISYQDPETGDFIEAEFDIDGNQVAEPEDTEIEGEPEAVATDDVLQIRERVENLEQAQTKAQEALRRANRGKVELDLDCEFEPIYAAGMNFTMSGLLKFSGKYQIQQATHNYRKGQGLRTSIKAIAIETEVQAAEDGASEPTTEQ